MCSIEALLQLEQAADIRVLWPRRGRLARLRSRRITQARAQAWLAVCLLALKLLLQILQERDCQMSTAQHCCSADKQHC